MVRGVGCSPKGWLAPSPARSAGAGRRVRSGGHQRWKIPVHGRELGCCFGVFGCHFVVNPWRKVRAGAGCRRGVGGVRVGVGCRWGVGGVMSGGGGGWGRCLRVCCVGNLLQDMVVQGRGWSGAPDRGGRRLCGGRGGGDGGGGSGSVWAGCATFLRMFGPSRAGFGRFGFGSGFRCQCGLTVASRVPGFFVFAAVRLWAEASGVS